MKFLILSGILFWVSSGVLGEKEDVSVKPSTPAPTNVPGAPQPIYKPPEAQFSYLPPQAYPYYDGYTFDGGFYPPQQYRQNPNQGSPAQSYMSSIIPATQSALQFTLKVLAKFGLFLIGGAALLLVGGVFTTAVCSLTPLCVISFPGFTGLDRESVRSLMTPDKISAAAAMVQDAIGKYQRLQRAVSSTNN